MKKKKDMEKIRIATIVLACFVVLIATVLIYSNSVDSVELQDSMKMITFDSATIDNKVKEYFNFKGLVDTRMLENWKIDKKTMVTEDVYYLEGYYSCSDSSASCVYQDVEGYKLSDGSYPFSIYAYLDDHGDIYRISSVFEKDNEVIQQMKEYFEENGLLNSQNLIRWEVTSKLVSDQEEQVYLFEGRYKCLDDSTSCVKLQSGNNSYGDGSYQFKVYGSFVEKNNRWTLVGVSREY